MPDNQSPTDNLPRRTVLSALGAGIALSPLATSTAIANGTFAGGSECTEFTATMKDSDGNVLQVFELPDGEDDKEWDVPASDVGATLETRGKYVEWNLDLDTFTISDYLFTAEHPFMTTDEDVVVFEKKEPLHGETLDGAMELRLKEGGVIVERTSSVGLDVKIQSKNCTQGGIFQMEPESDSQSEITVHHVLGPGFDYHYDDQGRVLLSNGPHEPTHDYVIARESPEFATLASDLQEGDTTSKWDIQSGGRAGFVAGEDATE